MYIMKVFSFKKDVFIKQIIIPLNTLVTQPN